MADEHQPTNAEVIRLLESMRASQERDIRERSAWQAKKDERDERVQAAIMDHGGRLEHLETEGRQVRTALGSHHDIEMGFRADLASLGGELKAHLARQDAAATAAAAQLKADADARANALAEERRQESLAYKRVTDRKDMWLKFAAIVVPIFVTAITVAGGAFVAWENQKAREDTAAQFREFRRGAPFPPPAPTAP